MRCIDCQHLNHRPTFRSQPEKPAILPSQMIRPSIPPGMEQRNDALGLGINSGDVRSFVSVAGETGEREIVERRSTTVLYGYDMIHFKGGVFERLRHLAVFAARGGSFPDLASQQWPHQGVSRSETRAFDFSIPSKLLIRS